MPALPKIPSVDKDDSFIVAIWVVLAILIVSVIGYVSLVPRTVAPSPSSDTLDSGMPPFDYQADVFLFYSLRCPYCWQQLNETWAYTQKYGLKLQTIMPDKSDEGNQFYIDNTKSLQGPGYSVECSSLPFTIIKKTGASICGFHKVCLFLREYDQSLWMQECQGTIEDLSNVTRITDIELKELPNATKVL